MARMALVPVFLLTLPRAAGGFDTTWRLVVFGIFAVASSHPLDIDDALAGKHGLITDFGKIADPIADKALTGAALGRPLDLDLLPWWITIVIAVRELGVTLLRFWVLRYGVIPASRGGKIKTLAQTLRARAVDPAAGPRCSSPPVAVL